MMLLKKDQLKSFKCLLNYCVVKIMGNYRLGIEINEGYGTYLAHHGIKGQKWGIRRFQHLDGTLTEEGKIRYGANPKNVPDRKLKSQYTRFSYNGVYNSQAIRPLNKVYDHYDKDKNKPNWNNDVNCGKMYCDFAKAYLQGMGYTTTDEAIGFLASKPWFMEHEKTGLPDRASKQVALYLSSKNNS